MIVLSTPNWVSQLALSAAKARSKLVAGLEHRSSRAALARREACPQIIQAPGDTEELSNALLGCGLASSRDAVLDHAHAQDARSPLG